MAEVSGGTFISISRLNALRIHNDIDDIKAAVVPYENVGTSQLRSVPFKMPPILVLLHGRHIKRNWSFFGGKGVIFRFSDNIYGGFFISWQNTEHFCTHCCQIEDAGGTKVHKPWFLFQVEHILGFGAAVVIVLTIIIVLILYLILQCQARRRRKRGASVVCGETTSNRLAHWYNTFIPYLCG